MEANWLLNCYSYYIQYIVGQIIFKSYILCKIGWTAVFSMNKVFCDIHSDSTVSIRQPPLDAYNTSFRDSATLVNIQVNIRLFKKNIRECAKGLLQTRLFLAVAHNTSTKSWQVT